MKTVLLLGSFDTKGEEYAFVERLIVSQGHGALKVDFGTMGRPQGITADIGPEQVAEAAGRSLQELRERNDRGHAMAAMSRGTAEIVKRLYAEGRFHAVLGMGGSGGSSVISAAMRTLPLHVPKVLVSTIASGQASAITGTRNIVMIPSVVDVSGINRISEIIYRQAVGAVCGMLQASDGMDAGEARKPVVAITMFGNTTPCVDKCRERLTGLGYEVIVFHGTGAGGRAMEELVEDGLINAVLDITTTEWADELCGGIFTAGPTRLEAPGRKGIPHLIAPGCLDMVNFGPIDTVPAKYANERLVEWNPMITLMRTNVEQNRKFGRIFAEKANRSAGPVCFMIPTKGFSQLDSPGNPFWWPEADQAMVRSLKETLRPGIPVIELDAHINDAVFADRAVDQLLRMMN
jgi:Uncharacterized conserved protein